VRRNADEGMAGDALALARCCWANRTRLSNGSSMVSYRLTNINIQTSILTKNNKLENSQLIFQVQDRDINMNQSNITNIQEGWMKWNGDACG